MSSHIEDSGRMDADEWPRYWCSKEVCLSWSLNTKWKIYSTCVLSVLLYGADHLRRMRRS